MNYDDLPMVINDEVVGQDPSRRTVLKFIGAGCSRDSCRSSRRSTSRPEGVRGWVRDLAPWVPSARRWNLLLGCDNGVRTSGVGSAVDRRLGWLVSQGERLGVQRTVVQQRMALVPVCGDVRWRQCLVVARRSAVATKCILLGW